MHRICYLQWRNGYMCIILKGMLQFWSTQIWGNGSLATYIPSPYPLNVKGSNWQVLGLVGALYFALPDPAVYFCCLSRSREFNYWGCLFIYHPPCFARGSKEVHCGKYYTSSKYLNISGQIPVQCLLTLSDKINVYFRFLFGKASTSKYKDWTSGYFYIIISMSAVINALAVTVIHVQKDIQYNVYQQVLQSSRQGRRLTHELYKWRS